MKTALITGCNGGLGVSLLEQFSALGYDVIACIFPHDESFDEKKKTIEDTYGNHVETICFDSSTRITLEDGIRQIVELNKPIDVLINNAGISIIKPIFNIEYEDLEKSFTINYISTVMITKAVADIMIHQSDGGSIVNITSMVSLGSQPGGSCYDASKAALNQFTKSMAQELAPFNIRVNAIAAAPMNTPMYKNLTEKTQKKALKGIAMKRPAETDEVAKVAMFLASQAASFITGDIIRVDGGAII